jgi:glyoxylase-like metal-dependent hydrolase (beta-lactamase superfamily II)
MQDASANVYGSMACHLLRHSILMRIWRLAAAVGVVMLVGSLSAEDARSVIAEASRAMGVVGVNSVTLAGTAVYGNFGQSQRLSFGLAFTTIGNYNRTFDFARGISHSIGVASPGIKQLEIWTTPWGFLLGAAAASNLTLKTQTVDKVRYRVVSYSTPFRASSGRPYTIAGYISPQGIVDKVETWIDHPLMGDLEVMFNYGNYQDAAGLKVPTKVSQKNIGMEVYVARFAFAAANPPDLEKLLQATVPDVAAAPVPMLSKPLAAGVYLITGGYDALVVELKDSVVILGGGGNEARGLALIAEARRLVPGKPIAYAVNMHGHFDHAMVLPAFASAGITILTDDPNQYFLQESLNTPRTLVGDAFAKSKRHAKVESVIEKRVLGDATRSIELHHLKLVPHADGMLAAWLPKERILFVSDIEPPIAGQPLTPSLVALEQNLDRLGLEFETFISNGPRSTPPLSRSEFMARLSQAARAGER